MKKEIITEVENIGQNDLVLLFGYPLFLDKPLQEKLKNTKARTIYLNPIDYKSESLNFAQYIKYEVGAEEAIAAMLLCYFAKNLDENLQEYIDELDLGYLSAEASLGEEELEEIYKYSKESNNTFVFFGDDFFSHKNSKNIINILSALKKHSNLKLIDTRIIEESKTLEEVEDLNSYNGTIIYCNAEISPDELIGGTSFANIAKIKNGDEVQISLGKETLKRVFRVDENLKGTIALYNNNIKNSNYSYMQAKISSL